MFPDISGAVFAPIVVGATPEPSATVAPIELVSRGVTLRLTALVQNHLHKDPFTTAGQWMACKRLEEPVFKWHRCPAAAA